MAARRTTPHRVTRSTTRSTERGNDLVLAHLGVAEAIARRYSAGSRDTGDLQQVAYLGLVKAARHFDPERGDVFVAYAVPTISGEIKRYLRDSGWFVRPPRQVQELRAQLAVESPRLAQLLGHQPTPSDLAAALGQDLKHVQEALSAHEHMRPASLNSALSTQEGEIHTDTIGSTDPRLEKAERMATIAAACRTLSSRERRIVYLRFFEEKTQQEIGSELGVTQMQISRLLTHILETLRERMTAPATPRAASALRSPTRQGNAA